MAWNATPRDSGNIPLSSVGVPGNSTPVVLQGSTNTNTDANGNLSAPANMNIVQVGSVTPQLDGAATNKLGVSLYGKNTVAGDTPLQMAGSDAVAATSTLFVAHALYNGATMDQQRANLDNIVAVASAAYTTTQTQADQTNYNHRGVVVVLNVTNAGTGSVTLEIDGKDPVSGAYYALLTSAAVTTNSTNVYRVYPGLTAVANATVSDVLPRTWRVKVTAGNANPITYSVGCMLIL